MRFIIPFVFVACLAGTAWSGIYFSEDFEDTSATPDWHFQNTEDTVPWATIGPAAAATGTAGLRVAEGDHHTLKKNLFWHPDSEQIAQGFYCTFAFRLHKRVGIVQDAPPYMVILMFNLAIENDQFYSNPTLIVEQREDSLLSLVLLQRKEKGGDPARIPRWGSVFALSFETWYAGTIFMQIKDQLLTDSLFINDSLIGQGSVRLAKKPGFLQAIFAGIDQISSLSIGSLDMDNISISSTKPVGRTLLPPACDYSVAVRCTRSDKGYYAAGDTVRIEFTYPPIAYDVACIDFGMTSEEWKGPRSPRWGPLDQALNWPFSLVPNSLLLLYPQNSDLMREACLGTDDTLACGLCDSCYLRISEGIGVATIVLPNSMKQGKWTLSSYLMNAKTAQMNPFPEVHFTFGRQHGKTIWIVSLFIALVLCAGGIIILRVKKSRKKADVQPENWVRLADKIDAYITENYRKADITSVDIAGQVFLSEKRAGDIYFAVRGVSPVTKLRTVRINAACARLRETADPIATIAYETGFSDPVVFQRSFKKIIGKTPGQYREENQKR